MRLFRIQFEHVRQPPGLLIASVSAYASLALGLTALGAHVYRNTLRVIHSIETIGKRNEQKLDGLNSDDLVDDSLVSLNGQN